MGRPACPLYDARKLAPLSDDPTVSRQAIKLISPAHAGECGDPPPATPRNGTRSILSVLLRLWSVRPRPSLNF